MKAFVGAAALAFALAATPATAQVCSFRPGPDVIVGSLQGIANYAGCCGGQWDALSLGTTSCNLGDTNLMWISGNSNHPVIGGTLYRLKDEGGWWSMEQIGQSWLKHGFFALSQTLCCSNCSSTSGSALGTGCSDPYTAQRNGSQGNLGPKWQVDANKGIFTYPPANPTFGGSTARRLEVQTIDLEPTASTTTQYYGEGHYVTPDDAQAGNHNNNASYRRVTVSGSGSAWTFGLTSATVRERSAIEAWTASGVDANAVLTETAVPGEGGKIIVGHSATDIGGGMWHYEYAVYNMNSDDGVRAFSVPAPTGASMTNQEFHDVVYRWGDGPGGSNFDGTDWPATLASGSLTWEAVGNYNSPGDVSHNAIRWGNTFNFRFDSDAAPTTGDITLTTYKAGEASFAVSGIQVPAGSTALGTPFCNSSDGSLAACPCANPGNPDSGCDNVQGTGGVFMEATAFTPDGGGGGTATFTGTDFNAVGTPGYVLIRSTVQVPAAAGFDGALCLGGTVVRVGSGFAVGGSAVEPYTHGAMASPGSNYYQLWYRNQPAMFCTPDAANLSNGYELVW
jgi:hypothetical protein